MAPNSSRPPSADTKFELDFAEDEDGGVNIIEVLPQVILNQRHQAFDPSRDLQLPCVLWFDTNPHLSVWMRQAAGLTGVAVYSFATEDELLEFARANAVQIRDNIQKVRVLMNRVPFFAGTLLPRLDHEVAPALAVLVYSTQLKEVKRVLAQGIAGVRATNNPLRCLRFVTFINKLKLSPRPVHPVRLHDVAAV